MGENEEDLEIDAEIPEAADQAPKPRISIGTILEFLLKNLIIIIIAVLLSAVITVIVVRVNVSKASQEAYQVKRLADKPKPLAIFPLGDFKVNTADKEETHFVRVTLNIAYDGENKNLPTELGDRRLQMRDSILRILNSKVMDDIDEAKDRENLKEEIKKVINAMLNEGEVLDIYYDEFVIS